MIYIPRFLCYNSRYTSLVSNFYCSFIFCYLTVNYSYFLCYNGSWTILIYNLTRKASDSLAFRYIILCCPCHNGSATLFFPISVATSHILLSPIVHIFSIILIPYLYRKVLLNSVPFTLLSSIVIIMVGATLFFPSLLQRLIFSYLTVFLFISSLLISFIIFMVKSQSLLLFLSPNCPYYNGRCSILVSNLYSNASYSPISPHIIIFSIMMVGGTFSFIISIKSFIFFLFVHYSLFSVL